MLKQMVMKGHAKSNVTNCNSCYKQIYWVRGFSLLGCVSLMLWSSLSLHSSSRTLVMLSLLSNARATDSRKILKDDITENERVFIQFWKMSMLKIFKQKNYWKTSQMVILEREPYKIMRRREDMWNLTQKTVKTVTKKNWWVRGFALLGCVSLVLWSSLSLHSSSRTTVMLSLLSNAGTRDSRKILKDYLTENERVFTQFWKMSMLKISK